MSDGYTYTTLNARRGEPARIDLSFHLDGSAWLSVPGDDTDKPHLLISHGDVSARISPADPDHVTEQDARIARQLADQAAAYAAAIERLAAAQQAGNAAA
jgi:hypothetical protein